MSSRIKILEKEVALKIAAGEVIERPASVLRELLDNSIDALSSEINVYLTSSGMEEIRVIDNGSGMGREDLEICFLPHATSKIEQIEDIYRIWTLGFRGEALSSIASSARTEIISSVDDSGEGYTLKIDSSSHEISSSRANRGTIVSVKDLFYMFPARKNFLKSPSAETGLCKTTFLEKAASNPDICFRLFIENKIAFFLPASSMSERIALCYPAVFKEKKMISEINYREKSFSVSGILNSPELTRKDRKYIHIYINGRRIQEYSLVQAVCYGYSNFIPGGVFPSAVIFINADPELVDFNIHPAKKEARIKNIRLIHHALSETIAEELASGNLSGRLDLNRNVFSSPVQNEFNVTSQISEYKSGSEKDIKGIYPDTPFIPGKDLNTDSHTESAPESAVFSNSENIDKNNPGFSGRYGSEEDISDKAASENNYSDYDALDQNINTDLNSVISQNSSGKRENLNDNSFINNVQGEIERANPDDRSFRYIGSLFNLFLICEKDDDLYLIDQHAADEKIIFEKLSSSKPDVQPLLIPLYPGKSLIINDKIISDYEELGIIIKKDDTGDYYIDAMPAQFFEIRNDVLKIITESPGNINEIRKNLFASISCKKAVKKGDSLTAEQAVEIIRGAFNLKQPFCPHGRPVWKKITKQELLEEINRIV